VRTRVGPISNRRCLPINMADTCTLTGKHRAYEKRLCFNAIGSRELNCFFSCFPASSTSTSHLYDLFLDDGYAYFWHRLAEELEPTHVFLFAVGQSQKNNL
jgi:hypothetical protein